MIRISGVIMPQRKHIYIALQDIYGIGKTRAVNICKRANIKTSIRVIDIASEKIINIQNIVNSYKIEGELRREVSMNIKRLVDIKSYRGKRHKAGLPCRGQRTKTNAKTRKKKQI
jgi:small subunit ribosomal protein S13